MPSLMEAAPTPKPAPKERTLDQFQVILQSLRNDEPLTPEVLIKISYLVQTKYIDTFFPKEEAEEQVTQWLIDGFGGIFRDFWNENKIPEEGGEGFRDLCLRALKERDLQKQRIVFEEVSRRLGDDMLKKEKKQTMN